MQVADVLEFISNFDPIFLFESHSLSSLSYLHQMHQIAISQFLSLAPHRDV